MSSSPAQSPNDSRHTNHFINHERIISKLEVQPEPDMEALFDAINNTPIIDHHAHNLLLPARMREGNSLTITTEAEDGALKHATSSLAHIRAVKQLAGILGCAPKWEGVEKALAERREKPDDEWSRFCFQGIEMLLIDDFMEPSKLQAWEWHDRLTPSGIKKIVRIEKVAENILRSLLPQRNSKLRDDNNFFARWIELFMRQIKVAANDPEVAGFKSVICYRTGLAIPKYRDLQPKSKWKINVDMIISAGTFPRIQDPDLNPLFVHLAVRTILNTNPKPFQFHTGLGDKEITLALASPSHMQSFIEEYPALPIVLLHASYPFTKEAGYLASVYSNVYLDIGEVFPMVSQDGQESIIRESLELTPSEKLMWSTDGHYYPETYLLAVLQIREGLKTVLQDNVQRGALDVPQAVKIVQDMLFTTADELYKLGLRNGRPPPYTAETIAITPSQTDISDHIRAAEIRRLSNTSSEESDSERSQQTDIEIFERFVSKHPELKFIRLQWVDYTSMVRLRIVPLKEARSMIKQNRGVSVVKVGFSLLQVDIIAPGMDFMGEYNLIPCLESLKVGKRKGYATIQGEFQEKDGSELTKCPRTSLRKQVAKAKEMGITYVTGFEIEVVFMTYAMDGGKFRYGDTPINHGHAWAGANALHNPKIMTMVEEIHDSMLQADIDLVQIHPESAPGQYEFVLGPQNPLDAVDTLIAARDIIYATAQVHGMKATLIPKPYPMACGTGAHVHLSLSPEKYELPFYSGVLSHLEAITAFSLPNDLSHSRIQDSSWAGGRYITWGSQNREAPLRKIEGSHWEFRAMDGFANPYLAMAAILAAGLQGVAGKHEMRWKDCNLDPASMTKEKREMYGIVGMLPGSLGEALNCLEKDVTLKHLLEDGLVDDYVKVKRAELELLESMDEEESRNFLVGRY